jgi:hypothetical protein
VATFESGITMPKWAKAGLATSIKAIKVRMVVRITAPITLEK